MKIQIKNRYDNSVIFECDAENISQAIAVGLKNKTSLQAADLRGANLRGANLCGADLRGANLRGANLCGADLRGANLRGANLCGADLYGADLCGANLREANLCGADFYGANLCGADLCVGKVKSAKVFSGLYEYIVMAILMPDDTRIVRMGCLTKPLEEWEKIGIRKSNLTEFPDNGSEASEERVIAFEFARATALALK